MSEYVTARIPDAMKQQIERIAKDERRSLSQVIALLLEEALKLRKNGGK